MARKINFQALACTALLTALIFPATACARGTYNTRDNVYIEDVRDTADLDLVQALVVNPGGYMEVTGQWTWYSPAKPPAAALGHGTNFSTYTSATYFTTIESGGPYGEQVTLLSRWFSAVSDMTWSNNSICTNGESSPRCLVLPVQAVPGEAALGAHSSSVLRVPSIKKWSTCDSQPTCKAPTDPNFWMVATLALEQKTWHNLLVPGYPYAATWFIRYPGAGGAPQAVTRMAKIISYFSYMVGTNPVDEYMGGATDGCTENDKSGGMCGERRNTGCPINLVTDTPGKGEVDFSLGNVYNPFTYSFCAGRIFDYYPLENSSRPPVCLRCDNPLSVGYAACRDPREGTWIFKLKVDAATGNTCDTTNCASDKADVPMYLDGIMITAGGSRINDAAGITSLVHDDAGAYVSPVFDSLSPKTQWTAVTWQVAQNRDVNGYVTTPVRIKWRAGNTPNPGIVPYWVGTDGWTFQDMVPFDGALEGMADAGTRNIVFTGQYFQYEANLTSWSENLLNRPPRRAVGDFKSCIRYPINYDGTLKPDLQLVGVSYVPDAGRIISKTINPPQLRMWKAVRYEVEDGGGAVVVDILDSDNNVVMAGVTNGEPLNSLDPGTYPVIRVRVTLYKNGIGAAVPKVKSFRVEYETQELLSVGSNLLMLSRNDEAAIRVFVEKTGMVEVKVHDAAGQMVKGVFRGEYKGPQMLQVYWNGRDSRGGSVAPGVYFVTAITPAGRQTRRIAVTR
jgi:hypothetical protein